MYVDEIYALNERALAQPLAFVKTSCSRLVSRGVDSVLFWDWCLWQCVRFVGQCNWISACEAAHGFFILASLLLSSIWSFFFLPRRCFFYSQRRLLLGRSKGELRGPSVSRFHFNIIYATPQPSFSEKTCTQDSIWSVIEYTCIFWRARPGAERHSQTMRASTALSSWVWALFIWEK